MVNGLSIHGGLRAYGATFMVFSDYLRPALRLAALMEAPSIFVLTHDSVLLGEDGPTHQPIEHLAALRAIPNVWVVRPADAGETAEAWETGAEPHRRPHRPRPHPPEPAGARPPGREGGVHRGGYMLRDGTDAVLMATGSEVSLALAAADLLAAEGPAAGGEPALLGGLLRPGRGLPPLGAGRGPAAGLAGGRVHLRLGAPCRVGGLIGIDHFGASAPAERLAAEFGLTPEAVAERLAEWLGGR